MAQEPEPKPAAQARVNVPVDFSPAELAIVDRALLYLEFTDTSSTNPDPTFKEEAAQRRVSILPLRLKLFQARNRATEQQ